MKKKSNSPKSTVKTKKEIQEQRYEFNIGDEVKYLGSLYEKYKNVKAKVKSRSTKNLCNNYEIEFEDGKLMEMKEQWIKLWEDVKNENN